MDFSSDFCAASQDILEKVGQEVARKYGEKDAKGKSLYFADRFIKNATLSFLKEQCSYQKCYGVVESSRPSKMLERVQCRREKQASNL